MKKLTITNSNGGSPVTILIDRKAEEALYNLFGDIDRNQRAINDMFHIIVLMQKLSAAAFDSFEMNGVPPVYITNEDRVSLETMLYLFDFIHYLKFSA